MKVCEEPKQMVQSVPKALPNKTSPPEVVSMSTFGYFWTRPPCAHVLILLPQLNPPYDNLVNKATLL